MQAQHTPLKFTRINLQHSSLGTVAFYLLLATGVLAGGLPEPGLTMYGTVRNAAAGDLRLTGGALTWTITPPTGQPVTVTALLTDIGGQFSYVLRVPFESLVGSATLSPNTLQLHSASTSYMRTNVLFTTGANTYPVALAAGSLGYFTFTTSDRGRMEQVDLTVNVPGLAQSPRFTASGVSPQGQFQMVMSGTAGQTYTLMASTNLVNWTPLQVFLCTNSVITVGDPYASNFTQRFYRVSP